MMQFKRKANSMENLRAVIKFHFLNFKNIFSQLKRTSQVSLFKLERKLNKSQLIL